MANNNSANVSTGKTRAAGSVFAGETSLTAPTDATSALPVGMDNLGYCSDDGLTNSVATDTTDIVAWGGDTVLTVRTSRSETFSWTFIEATNKDVLAQVYGPTNVSEVSDAITVIHNGKDLPNQMYVFEVLLTGNKVKRIVVPNAKITEVGDVVYTDGEAIGYEVTLGCFPDSSGNTAYEYLAAIA